ncbi:MAG: NAD(P)H-quinone oxidoreductase subunit 2, chloroplastic [Acidimicrobiales bacterium]|nr:MAG: NADH-quinone oxidoreductase subunit N [Actinomycetota bacterium]MBV6510318.1 NAD(P)H-quinone oxidoreductase subunit 2, chloroplastic [Acidimicrobiales bacterium]RIK07918.1 MAG: NADH-quinone oxidoreductase subunit N [Acidobacteriota bacterium]
MIGVLARLAQDTGDGILVPAEPIQAGVTQIATPEIQWVALLPHLILVVGGILLLTIASLFRHRVPRWAYTIYTVAVAAGAIIAALPLWVRVQDAERGPFSAIAGALGVDGFSIFITVIICAGVILTALLADGYLKREGIDGPELFVLLLLAASGGTIMASANDLIVLFLGLEILSISVYVMAAMHARRFTSLEAGMKYFILGAFSSAFFLYGIALVYGASGSTNMIRINQYLASPTGVVLSENGLLLGGFALLLVGFGFKVAAVPFHAWAPDVYQGAPTPVTAFMASAVKAGGFAAMLRVFVLTFGTFSGDWQPVVFALAVLSLLVGSVLAIVQTNVKRMLAYSSIAHAGFILVGVEVATEQGTAAALFYLAAYTFMVVGSFAVITVVGRKGDGHHELSDYRGLARRQPVLAFVFTILLLAQAGVPFTAGFFAKFYVISAAVDAENYSLAIIAMVSAVIAAFLYLRIMISMYMSTDSEAVTGEPDRVPVPLAAGIALFVACVVTVVIGFVPGPITDLANDAVPFLVQVG